MFKTFIKYIMALFFGIVGCLLFFSLSTPGLQAAGIMRYDALTPTPTTGTGAGAGTQSVTLSLANGTLLGHPGTQVTIAGTGFTAGNAVNLYATADQRACGTNLGLLAFETKPQVTIKADGSFQVTAKWPNNANAATSSYYICAVSTTNQTEKSVTPQAFTVAQDVTAVPSAQSVNPGDTLTITGENWVPAQRLTVAIIPNTTTGQAGVIAGSNGAVTSDTNGHFKTTVTFPANVPPGAYAISVIADGEPTLKFAQDNFVTINAQATPNPTATPAPTATATAVPTVVATATVTTPTDGTPPATNNGGGGGGTSGMTILIFAMGGLGIVMVIIGIIMLSAYSRHS